jgi:hypothetical protein
MTLNSFSPRKEAERAELERLCEDYERHAVIVTCLTCGATRRYAREHVLNNKLRCFHCGGYRLKPES